MAKLHCVPQIITLSCAGCKYSPHPTSLHHWPEWRSVRFLLWGIRFFFMNFELMDQTMQVSASDSQCAGAFRFAPTIFAQRAQDQVALKAANFIFIRHHGCFGFSFDGYWLRDGFLDRGNRAQPRRQLRDLQRM